MRLIFLLSLLLLELMAFGQRTIVGLVSDCEGMPVVRASIRNSSTAWMARAVTLENSKVGTPLTDENGNYSVSIPDTALFLIVTAVNYEPYIIRLRGKDSINVKLDIKNDALDGLMIKKPVIYLYPEKPTDVSLKVNFNGKLDFTYPDYNNGWNVTAEPNGKLIDKADGREHNYLFWDGQMNFSKAQTTYSSGFVVHKDSLVAFFQKHLPQMGLQPHEYNDFIVFWTPLMQKNEWNFVHFRTGAAYDIVSTNTVTPQPNTEIRVFMDFKKVKQPFDIPAQEMNAPERKGFTLVEWGGAEMAQEIYFSSQRFDASKLKGSFSNSDKEISDCRFKMSGATVNVNATQ